MDHGAGRAVAERNAALRRHEAVKARLAAVSAVAAARAVRVGAAEPVQFVVPQAALGAVRAGRPPSWTHYRGQGPGSLWLAGGFLKHTCTEMLRKGSV